MVICYTEDKQHCSGSIKFGSTVFFCPAFILFPVQEYEDLFRGLSLRLSRHPNVLH